MKTLQELFYNLARTVAKDTIRIVKNKINNL